MALREEPVVPESDAKSNADSNTDSQNRARPKRVGNALQNFTYDVVYGELEDRQAAEWFRDNWQKIVGLLAVVILAIWTTENIKSSQERAGGESSQRFSEIQKLFAAEILDVSEDDVKDGADADADQSAAKKQADRRALEDNLAALDNGTGIYPDAAVLYQAAIAIREKRYAEARLQLAAFAPEKLALTPSERISKERFLQELSALLLARSYIAEGSPEGRVQLKKLIENASMVSAEAAIALIRLSQTSSDREQALALVASLLKRKPELRDSMRTDLELYGIEGE